MNKLFSKIAALSVGLAMAVGVGVALGHEGVREVRAADETYTATGTNAQEAADYNGTDFSIDWDKGTNSNAPKFYTSGSAIRCYGGNTITVASTTKTISTIELGFGSSDGSNAITTDVGSYSNGTWTGEESSIVFTIGGTSGNRRIASVAVTYKTGGDPTQDTLVVKLNDATESPVSLPYSSTGGWLFYANDKDGNDINSDWTSSDESVFTVFKNGNNVAVVEPQGVGTANLVASAEGFNDGVFVLTITPGTLESLEVTGSMSKTSYTTNDVWSPAGLAATGTYDTGYVGDVTSQVSWSYNPATPAEGVTSVVATATIGSVSDESAAQAVTVSVAHAGTAADPFTVAEGIAKCQEIGTTASGDWYVKGIISAITSTAADATQYGNATFNLSDDGRNENYLIAFQVKYIGGVAFTEATFAELKVGYTAVVHGALVNYKGNTPEFNGKGSSSMVSLTPPETGDVDVVFEPETSLEIGDTGTFTATSNTAGVVFTWSVDKPEVLSVDASTGEYEALGLGAVRVTVTATAGDKEGSTHADIIVNGSSYMPVSDAVALAATVESGKTTDYYIYVEGYVKEFATSKDKSDNPRAFDIQTENQESSIMVYTNVNPYAEFIEGLALGTAVRVKAQVQNYNGTYELVNPVKVSSEYVALTFAYELLSLTDAVCEGYDGVTDNHDAIASIWETLSPKYSGLSDIQKGRLVNPSVYGMGDTVKNAMARYDYLTGKYDLTNFINGRTPVKSNYAPSVTFGSSNNSYIIIIVISAVSVMSFGLALFLRKKRSK